MDSQGWLTLAAVVVPTLAVAFTAWLNHRAHQGITTRIDGVDERAVQRDEAHRQALDGVDERAVQRDEAHRQALDGVDERAVQRDEAHRQALESIARDVSYMAGRQAERDQQR